MHRFFAEFFATFALVFAGTSAIVVDHLTGGAISHVGIALTFGLVVTAMIYSVGDVSGAHLNPAVTLGFWLARRLPGADVAPYVLSQVAGACTASVLVRVLFGAEAALGATRPAAGAGQSYLLEIVLTLLLMFTILSVSTGAKERGITAGLAIGAVVGLCALFAGPISGASKNPARSLGPALVGGRLGHLWIYLLAPAVGAGLAVVACRCARGTECCAAQAAPGSLG
jgi:aquaporin Z